MTFLEAADICGMIRFTPPVPDDAARVSPPDDNERDFDADEDAADAAAERDNDCLFERERGEVNHVGG
jgi:hypothetical protein